MSCHAATAATLLWDANTETNIAGYCVYHGQQSRAYDTMIDVGNTTNWVLSGLQDNITYYFAVTAYNADGLESDFSDEVSYTPGATNPPPANQAPWITAIPDQVIAHDTTTGPLAFSVGDAETAPSNLTVTASSSNPQLIPDTGLVLSGTDSNRTINVTPAPGQYGSASITVTVNDGTAATQSAFALTVTGPSAPSISVIANQATNEDATIGPVAFTVFDSDTPADSLSLTVSSSDPTLIPATNIFLGGSGSNRTISLVPATNQNGTATISLLVSDGTQSATNTFDATFAPINDPPTISSIPDQTVTAGTSLGPVPFTINDIDTPITNLTLSAISSDPVLLPPSDITFSGSGTNRGISATPASGQNGTATITVTVSDGLLSASNTFAVTVKPATPVLPTFGSTAPIAIPLSGTAAPYPSIITVSNVQGNVSSMLVTLTGLTHAWPDDIDILLVAPNGQAIILMSDVGAGFAVTNLTFSFSDGASSTLPDQTHLTAGTYKPTNIGAHDTFPAPAPPPPAKGKAYDTLLSTFTGMSANGQWSLYIVDDSRSNSGTLAGWSLTFDTGSAASSGVTKSVRTTASTTTYSAKTQTAPDSFADVPTVRLQGFDEQGSAVLRIRGLPAQQYRIEESGNCASWIPAGTVLLDSQEAIFVDSASAASGTRFYRVVEDW